MDKQQIIEYLDRLGSIQDARTTIALDYDAKRAAFLATVQDELNALDAELNPALAAADDSIADLTSKVKAWTLEHGASVKGTRLQAVFVKGRVSWDTKQLDGFAAAHPELLAFRKEGEPSVTLRTI